MSKAQLDNAVFLLWPFLDMFLLISFHYHIGNDFQPFVSIALMSFSTCSIYIFSFFQCIKLHNLFKTQSCSFPYCTPMFVVFLSILFDSFLSSRHQNNQTCSCWNKTIFTSTHLFACFFVIRPVCALCGEICQCPLLLLEPIHSFSSYYFILYVAQTFVPNM